MKKGTKIILIVIAGALLSVGSCVGLVGFVIWKIADMPDYVTVENIEAAHGDALDRIRNRLIKKRSIKWSEQQDFGPDVMAIFRVQSRSRATRSEVEVYGKYDAEIHGSTVASRCGIGTLRIGDEDVACLIYVIHRRPSSYQVFLRDTLGDGD